MSFRYEQRLLLISGPPITSSSEVNALTVLANNNMTGPNDIATGPFTIKTNTLTTYSQQLWVIAKLSTNNNDGKYNSSKR